MEFSIPTELPQIPPEQAAPVQPASGAPTPPKATQELDEEKARSYFVQNDVVPMLNLLLSDLYLSMPPDPIDHMTKWLLCHVEDEETNANAVSEELSKRHHAAVVYSNKFKLPHLFEELLGALLEDAPEDQVRFATSWLRWNKNNFIARHLPEGYREYHEQRNKDGQGAASPPPQNGAK